MSSHRNMPKGGKRVSLGDFLTDSEIEQAVFLKGADEIYNLIVLPNIDRINASLGGKNCPHYLSRAVELAITVVERDQSKHSATN